MDRCVAIWHVRKFCNGIVVNKMTYDEKKDPSNKECFMCCEPIIESQTEIDFVWVDTGFGLKVYCKRCNEKYN